MEERKKSLAERLEQYPRLKARVEEMLDLVESREQEVEKAAEAEEIVGEQLQQIGQETLQVWAENRHERQRRYWEGRTGVSRKEKKDSTGTRGTDQ